MSFTIESGDNLIACNLEKHLTLLNCAMADDEYFLYIDRPNGWLSLQELNKSNGKKIFFTDNACPSYLCNLLEDNPTAILSTSHFENLEHILPVILGGLKITPVIETPLKASEQKVLKLMAQSFTNKDIAKMRNIQEGSVKNLVTSIYDKLNLSNRVEASHYYYGNWHLLRSWSKPATVKRKHLNVLDKIIEQ